MTQRTICIKFNSNEDHDEFLDTCCAISSSVLRVNYWNNIENLKYIYAYINSDGQVYSILPPDQEKPQHRIMDWDKNLFISKYVECMLAN